MTNAITFCRGDKVAVNRPDGDSGISCILSSYAALTVTRVDGHYVYLDTSKIPLLGRECFVFNEEIDRVR